MFIPILADVGAAAWVILQEVYPRPRVPNKFFFVGARPSYRAITQVTCGFRVPDSMRFLTAATVAPRDD